MKPKKKYSFYTPKFTLQCPLVAKCRENMMKFYSDDLLDAVAALLLLLGAHSVTLRNTVGVLLAGGF